MEELVEKAAILHEALPYIRRFHRRTFVVKYGGHTMVDNELKESFARDVCLLRYVGINMVVVHGGGPQINGTLERMGISSKFSAGLRITDDDTMDVVEMVLAGSINSSIVSMICKYGGRAVGLSGKDDRFIRAQRKGPVTGADESGRAIAVDLGRVGQIEAVNPTVVQQLIANDFIPVISPIAVDHEGHALNVNADTAAGWVARSLQAAKLILLTDVEGVKTKEGELVRSLRALDVESMVADGVIRGGMIPKVHCALDAVEHGVEKVHIIDGRRRHAMLLEIFTDSGVGTEIQRIQSQ